MRALGLGVALALAVAAPVAAVVSVPARSAAAATPGGGQLLGVSCTSPNFCMAVGTVTGSSTTLTESWNGQVWSIVPSPSTSGQADILAGVSCVSSTDCVAVGSSGSAVLVETWNGFSWSIVSTPVLGDTADFVSVSCTDSTSIDCVAVGSIRSADTGENLVPLAESWDGTTWSVVAVPNTNSDGFFTGVSCASATSCMAVGDTYECVPIVQGGGTQIVCLAPEMLVESWDGTNWSIDTTPNENETDGLSGVSCLAATQCVAMGVSSNTSTGADEALVESWNGTSWSVAYGPTLGGTEANLDSVSCISFTNCAGVGFELDPSPGVQEQTLALSWDGTTSSVVPTANPSSTFDEFDGVSCVTASFCAGVGSTQSPFPSTPQSLLETWNGSSWSVAPTATTTVVLPSSPGAAVGGTGVVLDATASASAGVASVEFTLTGGADSQKVIGTATPTIYGYVFVWNTKAVPDGTYTLQSLVADDLGHTASSTGFSITVDNTPPTTTVIIPSAGASLQGTSGVLDATASAADGVKIAQVQFTLTGGTDNQTVIGPATPTIYGYVFVWNTTTVPDGAYTLQSRATDAAGNTAFSSGVSITVANPPPTTTVIIPSAGASLQGTSALLDATASASNGLKVAKVQFTVTGGSFNHTVIGTATPTIYGYLFIWNTSTVPNGTYAVGSLATDTAGNSGSSAGVGVNVAN
jgi:Bacterial Ig domain/Bacterial Ig-like domain (group 3)